MGSDLSLNQICILLHRDYRLLEFIRYGFPKSCGTQVMRGNGLKNVIDNHQSDSTYLWQLIVFMLKLGWVS